MVAYGSALSRSGSTSNFGGGDEGVSAVPYAQQKRMPAWEMKDIRWGMGAYITFVHVLALYGLVVHAPIAKAATLWFAFALWPIAAFGITGGKPSAPSYPAPPRPLSHAPVSPAQARTGCGRTAHTRRGPPTVAAS